MWNIRRAAARGRRLSSCRDPSHALAEAAKADGILRAHKVMANATIRDTAVYSIIAPERPAVRANLHWQMENPR